MEVAVRLDDDSTLKIGEIDPREERIVGDGGLRSGVHPGLEGERANEGFERTRRPPIGRLGNTEGCGAAVASNRCRRLTEFASSNLPLSQGRVCDHESLAERQSASAVDDRSEGRGHCVDVLVGAQVGPVHLRPSVSKMPVSRDRDVGSVGLEGNSKPE